MSKSRQRAGPAAQQAVARATALAGIALDYAQKLAALQNEFARNLLADALTEMQTPPPHGNAAEQSAAGIRRATLLAEQLSTFTVRSATATSEAHQALSALAAEQVGGRTAAAVAEWTRAGQPDSMQAFELFGAMQPFFDANPAGLAQFDVLLRHCAGLAPPPAPRIATPARRKSK